MDQGLVLLGLVAIGTVGLVIGIGMTLASLLGKEFRIELTRNRVRFTVSPVSKPVLEKQVSRVTQGANSLKDFANHLPRIRSRCQRTRDH
jgi:hypothetical protein